MIDKSKYDHIEIPNNLHCVVQDAIKEGLNSQKRAVKFSPVKKIACTAATIMLCFTALLNLSPVVAAAAYSVPILGDICRVLTFCEYHFEDDIKYVDVKIPKIDNTGKPELEKRVNLEIQKIMNERLKESEARAKEYYEAFVETGGEPKEFVPVGITVDYEIKQITPRHVSFVVSQYETRFSAYHSNYYYNIDMESGRVLTLRDWFGSNYRKIVADSIEQSIANMDEEKKSLLWDDISIIDMISENTDFYINENDQIVVVFDKYALAAGSAGQLKFVISANS